MTRFVMNKKDDLVDSALNGMIYASPWGNLVRLAEAAQQGSDVTASMGKAKAGRSSYL